MRQLNLIMLFEMRPALSWDICQFLPFHRPNFSSILKCHDQAQSQTVTVLVTKWFYKRDEINLDSNCPKNDRLCLFYHKKIKLKLWSLLLPNFILVPNRREVALTQASCIFPVVQCSLSNLFVYICVRFNHSLSWTVSVKPLIQYLKIEWCSFTEKKWQWAPSIVYAEH